MTEENEEERRKELRNLLSSLRLPDLALFQRSLKKMETMPFEEFSKFSFDNYSTLELLEYAENISNLLWFSTDTEELGKRVEKEFQIPILRSNIEGMVRDFVADLEHLNAKTSSSLEEKVDIVKEYNMMRNYPRLSLFDPDKQKDRYIFFYEAITYKLLDPIVRKLQPTKKKYLSTGECIQLINRKTKEKHVALLAIIDTDLRNGMQHYSFTYDEEGKRYLYTNKDNKTVSLAYEELLAKNSQMHLLFSFLSKEIDKDTVPEAIRKILQFLITREWKRFDQSVENFWLRVYDLTCGLKYTDLSYLVGLHVTGTLFLKGKVNPMVDFLVTLLQESSTLREFPHFIDYPFDISFSFVSINGRGQKKIQQSQVPLLKAYFSTLQQFLHYLPNKNTAETNAWMACSRILAKLAIM